MVGGVAIRRLGSPNKRAQCAQSTSNWLRKRKLDPVQYIRFRGSVTVLCRCGLEATQPTGIVPFSKCDRTCAAPHRFIPMLHISEPEYLPLICLRDVAIVQVCYRSTDGIESSVMRRSRETPIPCRPLSLHGERVSRVSRRMSKRDPYAQRKLVAERWRRNQPPYLGPKQ